MFLSRNSATSQQNEILFIVLKPFLSDGYMVVIQEICLMEQKKLKKKNLIKL